MTVKLISISAPTFQIEGKIPTPEELMTYIARVSSPKNQENLATAPKLLGYCIKNKHWSVFEMVNVVFEVTTSRAIAAQILRHKGMNAQEFSQRYQEVGGAVMYEARRQDVKNRQNSIDDLPQETKDWFLNAQQEVVKQSFGLYQQALEKNIAKECARFLLPMSTETKMYLNASVRSLIHYLQVRCDESTQLEHRELANAIKEVVFKPNFPNISEALGWTGLLSSMHSSSGSILISPSPTSPRDLSPEEIEDLRKNKKELGESLAQKIAERDNDKA